MSDGIFISYKRGADSADARSLFGPLNQAFPDRVHMDIDTFPLGEDFVAHIERELSACHIVLVVIGRGFHERMGELHNQADFMRLELERALGDPDKKVVPVLFDGAGMPDAANLPEPIRPLVFRGGQVIDHANAGTIIHHGLIPQLQSILDARPLAQPDPAPEPLQQLAEAPQSEFERQTAQHQTRPYLADSEETQPVTRIGAVPDPVADNKIRDEQDDWKTEEGWLGWSSRPKGAAKSRFFNPLRAAIIVACALILAPIYWLVATESGRSYIETKMTWLSGEFVPNQIGNIVAVTPEIEAAILAAAFSTDGRLVASGSIDGRLRLWDAKTGAPIGTGTGRTGHESAIVSLAFSPDGSRIVSGSFDTTLRLWDAATGAPVGEPMRGHSAPVGSVAFSPDGTRIVSGSADDTLRLWDADTGAQIGEPLRGHASAVRSVAFSPDGSRIASGSFDTTIRLWDAATGAPIGSPLRGHEAPVNSVAFSPDGNKIVSASDDGTLLLWDADTGVHVKGQDAHTFPVRSIAVSPDGSRVISSAIDGSLLLRRAADLKGIATLQTGKSEFALSPDGRYVASFNGDPNRIEIRELLE